MKRWLSIFLTVSVICGLSLVIENTRACEQTEQGSSEPAPEPAPPAGDKGDACSIWDEEQGMADSPEAAPPLPDGPTGPDVISGGSDGDGGIDGPDVTGNGPAPEIGDDVPGLGGINPGGDDLPGFGFPGFFPNISRLTIDDPSPNYIIGVFNNSALPAGMNVCKAGGKVMLIAGTPLSLKSSSGLAPMRLAFIPTYGSQTTYRGSMGYGIQHNYNIVLTENSDTNVTIQNEDGTLVNYTFNGTAWMPQAGFYETLTKSSGQYIWRKRHGTQYIFTQAASDYRLTTIRDRLGSMLNLAYNAENRLASVTDNAGRALTFSYNSQGLLETVTDPKNRQTRYVYDSQQRLSEVQAPLNTITKFYYENPTDIYKMTRMTLPRAQDITLAYNLNDNSVVSISNALQQSIGYTVNKQLATLVMNDKRGNTSICTYWKGKVTSITDAAGVTAFAYDENNNRISRTFRNGVQQNWSYDAQGNMTGYCIDPQQQWAWQYDAAFNAVLRFSDPLGNTTVFSRDTAGNLTTLTDARGQQTMFTYYSNGKVKSVTNARQYTAQFEYDSYGNLTKVISPLNTQTVFTRDIVGNLTGVTNASGHAYTMEYDALDRLTRMQYPDSTAVQFTYDAHHNLTSVRRTLAGVAKTAYFIYDEADRLIQVINPLNQSAVFAYDAMDNLIRRTDANGKSVRYDYDAVNRLSKRYDRMDNATEFIYDGLKLRRIKTANGAFTDYAYDAFNRISGVTYADGSTEQFSFDAANRLVLKKDRRGNSISYSYLPTGRLAKRTLVSLPGYETSYDYDPCGNLELVTDQRGMSVLYTAFSYDALNRLSGVQYYSGMSVAYTYDAVGNRKNLAYPDGYRLRYDYDVNERLSALVDVNAGNISLVSYTYDDLGRRVRAVYGNGMMAVYGYDDANRLTSLVYTAVGGAALRSFVYTYDNVGNCLTMDSAQGQTTYTYDDNYRLVSAALPGVALTTYAYDTMGNRTAVTNGGAPVAYQANTLNQYTSVNGTAYTYDAGGNLSGDGIYTYGYDYYGRLNRVTKPGLTAAYTYDYAGRRTSKTVNGSGVYYCYDGWECIQETDAGSALVARYVYGPGIDEPVVMYRNGQRYFYLLDGLGSVIALTDDSGAVVESYTYDAFGKPEQASGIGNPLRFTAQRYDAESGKYYYRYRYYDPGIGRFLTPDPLKYHDGFNLYTYCYNNPVNWVDPYGLGAGDRTPVKGQPNSSQEYPNKDGGKTIRQFGPDGNAVQDTDYGHDHGAGDPHIHDWDWSGDKPKRDPGRPKG
ncbi:MAG: hypothetical protein NC924_05645 [Candidatus Omnitrophica bacterium]|nr:hypothetical protein [Candidatus Omnitrophota bacterium]